MSNRFSLLAPALVAACLISLLATPSLLAQNAGGKQALSLADLIEKVEPSCVRVDVTMADGRGIGSGFIINDAGWVATNHHVVAGGVTATVSFADKTVAEVEGVLAYDKRRDLALLKIKTNRKLKALPLAKEKPRKGENTVAIGAPVGLSFSATEGIISAIREGAELKAFGQDADGTWLQTSTPISSGNSGGPLLNFKGEVLGANTASLDKTQNINFAISSLDIADLMATAAKNKVRDLATIEPPKPSLPAPRPRPNRPTPPSSVPAPVATVACKLPAQRRFAHRYKVNKEVDAFDKDITLTTDWIPLEHNEPRLTSCGLQVSINFAESQPPSLVTWEVGTTAKSWIYFMQQPKFQALLDGQTADLGVVRIKSDLAGGHNERLTATLPLDRFLKIVLAKEVKIRMSNLEYALTSMQLECLRDMASQLSTGKTADSRFQVDRLALNEDPTAPGSLARRAAASTAAPAAEAAEAAPANSADQEKRAAGKLRLAKILLAKDAEAGQKNLREIIETYPDTKAAKEAQELLGAR
jgi:hypothetical protein